MIVTERREEREKVRIFYFTDDSWEHFNESSAFKIEIYTTSKLFEGELNFAIPKSLNSHTIVPYLTKVFKVRINFKTTSL